MARAKKARLEMTEKVVKTTAYSYKCPHCHTLVVDGSLNQRVMKIKCLCCGGIIEFELDNPKEE